jgi:hypothetical protein
MEQLGPTGRMFMKSDMSLFLLTLERIQVSLKSDTNNVTLHEDRYTFLIISRSLHITMRIVSDKICRENQNTIFCSVTFFFENPAIYDMWKNILERGRPQMTI